VYVHNDAVVSFGTDEKVLNIDPVFSQFGGLSQMGTFGSIFLPLGPGDLLVHHAIALGLHVTFLIIIKGALAASGSKLMPDKQAFGFHFPCDGPGRGGTCDISTWDSVYLAAFWSLNTTAWVLFYFHYKHLGLWEGSASQFAQNSSYLMSWFRDYLWFNSAPLIRAYDVFSSNDLAVWSWTFLAGHLVWATGFMFLISWRGYWQELLDIISVMHLKTPMLLDFWDAGTYTPAALSILQARLVGLSHFIVGFIVTYAAFVMGATT
jgi:photosystem I P700 chlorophyll a apoprotein A2